MKLLLKLLLFICVLAIGIYATTPMWMPLVLARQLPPGFQLQSIEFGYPGVSGVKIEALRVTGEMPGFGFGLSATEIQFSYKDWKTDVGAVTVDVHLQAGESGAADSFSLDDLSLPVTRLTTYPPEVAIRELRVILHHDINFEPGNIQAGEPLVLNFQTSRLLHQANNSYHLSSGISTDYTDGLIGRIDVDVGATSRKVDLRFPATQDTPPWLNLSIEQTDQATQTTTLIQALFDTAAVERKWTGPFLERISDGHLNRLDGKLEMEALFAGRDSQRIEYLALTPGHLRAGSGENSLNLDGRFLARHDNEQVTVTLPDSVEIQFEDRNGWIDNLFEITVPELHLQPKGLASAHLTLNANSDFIIQTGTDYSTAYRGGFSLDIRSPDRHLDIRSTSVQIDAGDFSAMDSITVEGLVKLNWEEKGAFTYIENGLDLKADELSISAEITSTDGTLFSNGNGTVTGGQITSMATSATSVDVSWHQLDLLTLSGKLTAKTHGFATDFNDETWSGFDFDIGFSLTANSDVRGSGSILVKPRLLFPIEFQGNVLTQRWNITLPASSIKLAQLDKLLSVAHMELPGTIRLAEGTLDLQGTMLVDDSITASVSIDGREMSASLLKSSAHNATLSLDSTYDDTIRAQGPVFIETINLAGGVNLAQVKADLDIESADTDTITLQNLSAELFDGQILLSKLHFSGDRIDDTTIELKHISLGKLLAFADIDGLEGTGFLDFSLPAGSDDSGMFISNGIFKSSVPGKLVYKKEGLAVSNIGMQALENFQYKDLSGTINYQPDGGYRIGVHLEGKNPDLYGGYPIVLNLNITGSLPELFEALFITGDFEESILKQIRIK